MKQRTYMSKLTSLLHSLSLVPGFQCGCSSLQLWSALTFSHFIDSKLNIKVASEAPKIAQRSLDVKAKAGAL